MAIKLGFHTPVTNPYLSSCWERLEESSDHYLSLTNRVATVSSPHTLLGVTAVTVQDNPWTFSQYAITFCKVISYAIFILPVVAFLLKAHRKHHNHYMIQNQAPPQTVTPPIIIDDDTPEQPSSASSLTSKEDLLRTAFLEHSTITDVLSKYRSLLQEKGNPYFFIERTSFEEDASRPFRLTIRKKTPESMKTPYPQTGGLALSIHSEANKHFTGLFVHFAERTIVYYDPFGTPMNAQTKTLIEKVKTAVFDPSNSTPIQVIDLKARHQYDGYNCGRYVIRFLTRMISPEHPLQDNIQYMKKYKCSQNTLSKLINTWIKTYSVS